MGMSRTSCGLGTDELGEIAKVEEPSEGNDEAVVVPHGLCYASRAIRRLKLLLLYGVAVARGKAKGCEPVDDMVTKLKAGEDRYW